MALRTRTSTIVATGVIALGLTSGSFALLDARAVAGDDGETLLERSRRAATQAAFEGVVEVQWRDEAAGTWPGMARAGGPTRRASSASVGARGAVHHHRAPARTGTSR